LDQKAKDDDIFSSDKRRVKDLLPQAISLIEGQERVSASLLQRRLKIGYALAAMILDAICEKGYIGEAEGAKPRKVISQKLENPM
jgi:S-DNA-T family DNA segregation ATPase FtsK/SpoIIIE